MCRAEEARQLARLRTLSSQEQSKSRYDAKHIPVGFSPGDYVWLWTPVRRKGLYRKFLANYSGPFVIVARLSDVNYVVARVTANIRRSRVTQVVHVARLKQYHHRHI